MAVIVVTEQGAITVHDVTQANALTMAQHLRNLSLELMRAYEEMERKAAVAANGTEEAEKR